jgi:hypothetical protein
MGLRHKGTSPPARSLVPWWLPHSDVNPAGAAFLARDTITNGQPQKQLAFHVAGQFISSLGVIAIRCERRQYADGEHLFPIGIAIPDGVAIELNHQPYRDGPQSGSNRAPRQLPTGRGDDERPTDLRSL